MKKILVLGGTGFVGRHVCEKLTRLSCAVTVPTRRRENAKLVQHLPRLDVLEANIHDPVVLAKLVAGHDVVINLVAILHGDEAAFERAHVTLPTALVRACAQTGVKRVVHVSALGAALDAPSMYQRSKARGEAALLAADVDATILRPSVIFGSDDKFLNMFASLQKVFPVMPLAGSATRFQPVWVEDVAQAIVNSVVQNVQTVPVIAEACGPDVFTLKELVQLAARYAGINQGRGRPVLALSMGLGRLQAALMRLLPGEPMLSRDNLDSMQVDNVAGGKLPGLSALQVTPTPLAAIAPLYLGKQSMAAHLLVLRKTSGRF
jgi:uncharacterized protein YbjT (DUF2867 family)